MYATNHDMGGDPDSPRGDGRYRPVLARGDGHMLYLMARSTALDFDWRFDNDLRRFGDPWNEPITKTGRKSIIHPIGPALVWTPLIWIAEGGAVIANVFGADIQLHGYTLWHQRFVFFSSVVFGCGAVLLGRRLARQAFGGAWSATFAAVAVLLGTSLTYYATYMPSYGHAMDAFACAAFLAYWGGSLGRTDVRRWLALGALLGFATLVRPQELALGAVVAFEIAWRVLAALRRAPEPWLAESLRWVRGGAIALAVAIVMLVPQFLEWHIVFGSATALPQGARYTRLDAPMIGEMLWSARNGWFSTTPIAYAGCIGLLLFPRRARVLGFGLLVAVAIQVYLSSTILDWWGGSSYGQRRLCSMTLPLVVGLSCLLWRAAQLARRWRRVPAIAWRALAIIVLCMFVESNLKGVGRLAGGKGAADAIVPTCCDEVRPSLRGTAQWWYDRIGNPFEFPANVIFAWRHDVPVTAWERVVGDYPLQPGLADLHDDARFYNTRGRWHVGGGELGDYLVGGWSEPFKIGKRDARVTTSPEATVLVPNLMPNGQRVTVWLAAGARDSVTLRWNGREVASAKLGTELTPVTFDLPDIELHTNELTVVGEGVAVADITLQLLRP